jgi:hypothetical protein
MLLLVGCSQSRHFSYRSLEEDTGCSVRPTSARYSLNAAEGRPVSVYVNCRAVRKLDAAQGMQKAFFDFHVRNRSKAGCELLLSAALLKDDEGNEFTKPRISKDAKSLKLIEKFTVEPGKRARATVTYEVPNDVKLAKIGSVKLNWKYSIEGDVGSIESKFVQVTSPARHYPSCPYYGHFMSVSLLHRSRSYRYGGGFVHSGFCPCGWH